jgi:hypothetical protein
MIFILKSLFFFSISFFILSFQVNQKSLFEIIQGHTGPLGAIVQRSIGTNLKSSLNKSKKIITGEPPASIKDEVRAIKSSSRSRDSMSDSEKSLLNDFIKKTTP